MNLVSGISFEISGDFNDHVTVWQNFLEDVNKIGSITIINSMIHLFPRNGFSGLVLIAESHIAIHTWPELGKAWVEFVTCGDVSALKRFMRIIGTRYEIALESVNEIK